MTDKAHTAPLHERIAHLAGEFAKKAWEHPEAPNSAFLQDHAYSLNDFAEEARESYLPDGDRLTGAQQRRIARTLASGHVTDLAIGYAPFDLPDKWISVVLTYADGRKIYGGISPEGDMHT